MPSPYYNGCIRCTCHGPPSLGNSFRHPESCRHRRMSEGSPRLNGATKTSPSFEHTIITPRPMRTWCSWISASLRLRTTACKTACRGCLAPAYAGDFESNSICCKTPWRDLCGHAGVWRLERQSRIRCRTVCSSSPQHFFVALPLVRGFKHRSSRTCSPLPKDIFDAVPLALAFHVTSPSRVTHWLPEYVIYLTIIRPISNAETLHRRPSAACLLVFLSYESHPNPSLT